MTHTIPSDRADGDGRIGLPLPPADPTAAFDLEIYVRFMRHIRHVPASALETKILASIQFAADMMDIEDSEITAVLVGLGLRAPRAALPASFLDFADRALMREAWEIGAPTASLRALDAHWRRIGEDRLAGMRYRLQVIADRVVTCH